MQAQTSSFQPFEDDFFSGASSQAAASAFGRPAAATQAAGAQQRRPAAPASLDVDPFDEPVFPVPQTPPKMKPRPSANEAAKSTPQQSPPQPRQAAAQVQPQASPATLKKRCVFSGCLNDRFARGYCALHLSDIAAKGADVHGPAPTPVSRIRNVHNLWAKSIRVDREAFTAECWWRILHNDDEHTIELTDNTFLGVRTVSINNKEVYRGQPDMGVWKLDATIGKSFQNSVNIKVVVVPNTKGYEYECLVDELRFDDAHQAFLTKLSGATVQQRFARSELQSQGSSGSSGGGGDDVRAAALRDALYVKQNWSAATEEEKTAMTGTKSKVTWHFSIHGRKHVLVLEYGSLSGKKKLLLDGDVLVEKKPSVLSANKHKRWAHQFVLDKVDCLVTTEKNTRHQADPRDGGHNERPFLFNFYLDSVVFEDCCLTETDLAGGDVSLDQITRRMAQTAVNKGASSGSGSGAPSGVSGGRRNSVHKPLSAEEYEAQMRDENERARQCDAKAREDRERKRAAKAAANKASGKDEESSGDSESESEDEDD